MDRLFPPMGSKLAEPETVALFSMAVPTPEEDDVLRQAVMRIRSLG